ncbi:MAG TPA: AAA family ATPase [Candidatus Limnocylindrales bacterium]|nr:AAA family ATPase [Candidatus Limnocylindrales bacterium]
MARALCPVLIGRDRELNQLEDALLAAHRGDGRVVALAGDAGMGKTRLAGELELRAQRAGTVVMVGTNSEADLSLPYLPFVEAIGNYLALNDLEAIKLRLGPAACRQLAQLLPQMEMQTTIVEPGDPSQAKLRLFEAILALLRLIAERSGLLLILEDLHWADASTRELLEFLIRRVRRARILLLATYRSDEMNRHHPLLPLVQGWQRAGTAELIELQPLEATGVAEMTSAIFEGAPVEPELRDLLFARSEGNPFVLEEILKDALDRGDIFRTAGGWDRKAIAHLKLPRSVKDGILLRVERMSDEDTDILRAAAVLGRCFDYRTLVGVSQHQESVVLSALRSFVQQQLMDEERGGRYCFRHALTREAIHDDLIAPERERLHACAAEVLGTLPDTDRVDLAYHLLAAGHWDEAVPVAMQAAADAVANRAYMDAAHLYERIVDHVEDRSNRAEVLCHLGKVLFFAGETRRGQRYLEEGIALLVQAGRGQEAAAYRLWLGRCYWLQARPDLARQEYETARDTLAPFGPSEELANAYVRLAGLASFDKEHELGTALAKEAVRIAEAAGADAPRIWAYGYLGDNLEALGRIEEGLQWLDRSFIEATERGYDWIASNSLFNAIMDNLHHCRVREALERLGHLRALMPRGARDPSVLVAEGFLALRAQGEPERARLLAEAALSQAEEAGETLMALRVRAFLATVYLALERVEDAKRVIPEESLSPERGEVMSFLYSWLAIDLAAGDVEAARSRAIRYLDFLRQEPKAWSEIYLLDRSMEALIAAGDLAGARQLLDAAVTAPFETHPLLARTRGRILLAEGEVARATELLGEAVRVLAEAEYYEEAWPARRLYAQALIRGRRQAEAERELRTVFTEASERRHGLEARLARERLSELGVEPPAVPAPDASPLAASVRQPTERLVTVMFVDVRGYTARSARQAPEQLADQISTFYRWAEQEIQRHGGLVDRYAGDAVMATFNVTGTRLDHSLQAVQAALGVRDKAAFAGLPVGIGIAVGAAVVGQFSQGSSVTAVGETINLAARLQAQAREGELLLSEEAHRRARGWLQEQELPAMEASLTLKGFAEPVRAYRLAARSTAPAGS